MICKLCGEHKKLVKSHVIPEAFFRQISNDGIASKTISNKLGSYPKRAPIGIYDTNILCQACEDSFHFYDDYAISIFRDFAEDADRSIFIKGRPAVSFNVEYSRIKLFFISMLWRAGISNEDYFKSVQLKEHENRLKELILKRDPGGRHDYSVVGRIFNANPEIVPMMGPYSCRNLAGARAYSFVFSGLQFFIKVASHKFDSDIHQIMLEPNKPWNLVVIEYIGSNYYNAALDLVDMQIKPVFSESILSGI